MPVVTGKLPGAGARIGALAATVLLLAATLVLIYRVGSAKGKVKNFAYTQDQAYVSLTLARNLTGASRRFGETTPLACSTSFAWPVVLSAAMRIPAVDAEKRTPDEIALVPLVINVVGAAVLVLLAGHLLRREVHSGWWMFWLLVGMGLLMPLVPVVLAGKEFTLHAITTLLALWLALAVIESEPASWYLPWLAAAAMLANMALRPEALGVLAATFVWAWVRRRPGRQLLPLLAGVGLLVVVGFGLVRSGAAWLPNPLLVHLGEVLGPNWREYGWRVVEHAVVFFRTSPAVGVLTLVAVGLLALRQPQTHSPDQAERERVGWLFAFVLMVLAHAALGNTGGHCSHEAYLVPAGIVAIGRMLGAGVGSDRQRLASAVARPKQDEQPAEQRLPVPSPYRGRALIALICLLPAAIVAWPELKAFVEAPQLSRDAFVRDRVAAAFVRTYFSEGPVLVNEPGTIAYATRAQLVDVSGRTSVQLARARLKGEYSPELIGQLAVDSGAPLALIAGQEQVPIPANWVEVGGWYRQVRGRQSDAVVRVYAVRPAMEAEVRMALHMLSESEQEAPGIEYWFVEPEKSTTRNAVDTQ